MKVLIIEDEAGLQQSIKKYLEHQGFVCEVVGDFVTGMEKVYNYNYDCVVVDIGLPQGSGLDIVKQLKRLESKAGIIIISAKNALEDKLKGLELGSDDYLTKPFHMPELGARVAAIIRRKSFGGRNVIAFDDVHINLSAKQVTANNKELDLTKKEYELLLYFISNKNKVISKAAIAEHLWGDNMDLADNYDFIYTHVKNLRKKIMQAGSPDYIKSVYGMGYKFSIPL